MNDGISRDLSKKLQQQLAAVLDRELNLLQHVISAEEIGVIMMEAAVMLARTSAATIGGYATSPADIATLYRATTSSIIDMISRGQDDGIARTQVAAKARQS